MENIVKGTELDQDSIIDGLMEDVSNQYYAQKDNSADRVNEIVTMTTNENQKLFLTKTHILSKKEIKYMLSLLNDKDFPITIYEHEKLKDLWDNIYTKLNTYKVENNKYIK